MKYLLSLVIVAMGWEGVANASLRLPRMFSDHMVLQRDMPVAIWGWADAGEEISLTFAGKKQAVTAGADGRWTVTLAPLAANREPQDLSISCKSTNLVFRDVLVGDVWMCSGQSNMEWGMKDTDQAKRDIPGCTNRLIRLLSVKPPASGYLMEDVPESWQVASPVSVATFSAVGYYFGRRLQNETGIPVGLINNAWGGSTIDRWTPAEAPLDYPELAEKARQLKVAASYYDAQMATVIDPLADWVEKARLALAKGEGLPPMLVNMPSHPALAGLSGIYNSRVAPLTRLRIKGVIWYQGESDANDGNRYITKKRCLIERWRKIWNQGDFPFYFVQLANYLTPGVNPAGGDGWAPIRMAQLKCLTIPRTGMAVTIDIGEGALHPTNKEDVGDRLALWALKHDHGRSDLVCSGPLYKGMTIEGLHIRVSFDHVGSGLMVGKKTGHGPAVEAQGESLKWFAVAGTNQVWFRADAVIEGSTVVVSSTNVPAPVAVRYAYTMNPAGCNLYNREGLPASPFICDGKD